MISGLSYYQNAILMELEMKLLKSLETAPWEPVAGPNSRVAVHYGYLYDYRDKTANKKATPFTGEISELASIARDKTGITFNQCIVNRYMPGQGIGFHIDSPSYGPIIACFTLGSGAVMEFINDYSSYGIYTERGSLYVMQGEARYEYKHGLRQRLTDIVNGEKIPRGIRVSVTLRTV